MTLTWRKSRYSANAMNCVEAAAWRKAARSYGAGECAEVAALGAVVGVRDSKLGGASPVLPFPAAAWRAFIAALKAGAA